MSCAAGGVIGSSGMGRGGGSAAAVLSDLWTSLDTVYFASIPQSHDLVHVLQARLKDTPAVEASVSSDSVSESTSCTAEMNAESFEMRFDVCCDDTSPAESESASASAQTGKTALGSGLAHGAVEVPRLLYDSKPGRQWIMPEPPLPISASHEHERRRPSVTCTEVIEVEPIRDGRADRGKEGKSGEDEASALRALLAKIEARKKELLCPVLEAIKVDQNDRPNRQAWFDADKVLLNSLSSRKNISTRGGSTAIDLPALDEAFLAKLGRALRDGEEVPPPMDGQDTEVDLCCSICGDGDVDDDNAILICDGCHFAAHQKCYGVGAIPEQEWFCRSCSVFPRDANDRPTGDRPVCVLCGRDSEFVGGGLMKPAVVSMPGKSGARSDLMLAGSTPSPTSPSNGAASNASLGAWAHVKCAVWIRECSIDNPTTVMEPIRAVIHPSRRDLVCGICKSKAGAKVQCAFGKCQNFYHVSCAARYGLVTEGTSGNAAWAIYCPRHSKQQQKQGNALLARLKAWRKSEHFTRLCQDKFIAPYDPRLVTAMGFDEDCRDPSLTLQWKFDSEEACLRHLLEPVERLCLNDTARALLPPMIRDARGDCPLLYPAQTGGATSTATTSGAAPAGSLARGVGAYGMHVNTAVGSTAGATSQTDDYPGVLYPEKVEVQSAEQLRTQTHAASVCGRCNECLMRANDDGAAARRDDMGRLVACQNCGLTVHWRCFLRPGLPPLNVVDYEDPKFTSSMYHCPYPLAARNQAGPFLCERCKYVKQFGAAEEEMKATEGFELNDQHDSDKITHVQEDSSNNNHRCDLVKFSETCCILCQQLGGLLVRVENPDERQWDPHGFWVHPRCVYWLLPTQSLSLNMTTTPIDINSHALIKSIPKDAHFSLCWICGQRSGCTVKCAKSGCSRRFHVSCGWYTGCHFVIKNSSGVVLAGSACRPTCGGPATASQNPAIDKQVQEALRNERTPLKRYAYCSAHRPPRLTGRKLSNAAGALVDESRMLSLPHYESPLHMQYANVVRARVNPTNLFVPLNPEAGIAADQRKKRKLPSNAPVQTPKKSAKRKAKRRRVKRDSHETSPPLVASSIINRDGITEVVDADDWTGFCPACGVAWDPNDPGMLIGCDQCDSWYHLPCVGLVSDLPGEWFCPNCTQEKKTPSRKRSQSSSNQ
ncbi:PHD finger protein [Perkinsus chesapeaki]|uniref:PHD finger protein n=1 Tax=Perkinsus chesapeaki TaxID=330153 RepID=A0A7J6LKE6_PERCH|nr:PHD finger protein [Perkinsus chesapeaki]